MMLFSWEKRVLFVHIQKTGGSCIEEILHQNVAGLQKIFGMHDHARWGRQRMPANVWDDVFKFAFVRNPWDRLVSWYSMIEQRAASKPRHQLNKLLQYASATAPTFSDYIELCTATITDNDGVKSFMFNQLDYVADENGNLIVDYVGRYERFSQDLKIVLDRLGIKDCAIPHVNQSKHTHYSRYYTERTRQIVADRYARDIEYFGYRFESD